MEGCKGRAGILCLLVLGIGAGLVGSCKDKGSDKPGVTPEVYLVLPQGGSVLGGNIVSIFTRNFTDDFEINAPEVFFGASPAAIDTVVNPAELLVITPPGAGLGPVDVRLTTTGVVQSGACRGCFQYTNAPPDCDLTGIIPDSGDIGGGEIITVTGARFEPGSQVFFGSDATQWTPSPFVFFQDRTALEVEVPASPGGQIGSVDVRVDVPNGASCSFQAGYTYLVIPCSILTVVPGSGTTLGGETITITGTGFDPSAIVEFGGAVAGLIGVDPSGTQITCTAPASTITGLVDVTVTNPTDSCSLPGVYEYVPPAGGCGITSVSPQGGSTVGTAMVTITGTDFEVTPDPLVEFGKPGNWVASPSIFNPQDTVTLQAEAPPWPAPARVDIRVTDRGSGQWCVRQDADAYLGPGQCAVFQVDPPMGDTGGGDTVTIHGANLDQVPQEILFGGVPVAPGQITWMDAGTVVVITPASPVQGPVDVVYVNQGPLPCALVNGYEYRDPGLGCTITGITPSSGPRTGGTWITITGTGFPTEVRVFFDQTPANPALTTVVSPTEITTVTPGILNPKCVDVTVIGVTGQASCTLPNGYCYTSGCIISTILPGSGPMVGGTVVIISGSTFNPAGSVRFGDNLSPSVDFKSPTEIEAVVPPSAISGPVDVKVFGMMGTQCVAVGGFFYNPGPGGGGCDVFTVIPSSGPATGGTLVTISGQGFDQGPPAPGVLFGFNPATNVTWQNPMTLTATTPQALFNGAVDVTVVNANGDACTLPDGFSYSPLPTCDLFCSIDSIVPPSGSTIGGNLVGILGQDFCQGAQVYFGVNLAPVQQFDPTRILVKAPRVTTAGAVHVVVVNPNGSVCVELNGYLYQ